MLQASPHKAGQAVAQRLEREEAWDAATQKDDKPGEETDTVADDLAPTEEEPTAEQSNLPLCLSLADVLKLKKCNPGDSCEQEVQAQFDIRDADKDGRLCPGEMEAEFEEQAGAPHPDQTGQESMLEATSHRLASIKEMFDAGKLDNSTHMGMLVELFSDPQHHGTALRDGGDLAGSTSLLGGEGSLAEGEPAADGSVVNRTVYRGPPQHQHGPGMAMLGWPVDADLDGDRRLSMDEYQRARLAKAGRGMSLLETGRLEAEFASADLDGNGHLEMDELKASLYDRSGGAIGSVSFPTPSTYFGAGECITSKPQSVGDGWCDDANNNEACMWDGGDCCSQTCSKGEYDCGRAGYKCQAGAVEKYRARNPYFPSPGLDVHTLRALWAWGRAKLAGGCASWQGESLSVPEWVNMLRAFNRGTIIEEKAKCQRPCRSDKSKLCGCGSNMCGRGDLYRSAGGLFGGGALVHKEFGTGLCSRHGSYSDPKMFSFYKALFIHEMAHTAGYSHPGYTGKEEWGRCYALGSWYDHCNGDRCTIASDACAWWGKNANGCGWLGCQKRCVKAEYSMTVPERACWCTRIRRGVRCESP